MCFVQETSQCPYLQASILLRDLTLSDQVSGLQYSVLHLITRNLRSRDRKRITKSVKDGFGYCSYFNFSIAIPLKCEAYFNLLVLPIG